MSFWTLLQSHRNSALEQVTGIEKKKSNVVNESTIGSHRTGISVCFELLLIMANQRLQFVRTKLLLLSFGNT